ncbi:S-layer homology domain-containing protein [Jeotgalibacillus sp. JSM ZJ347]|uniref:S-layer homology domain-containing protein n=1 Tax=Jeotgalibacillus sp. JSM ZJ347 TaxID=3342117 RepID=UPI0035A8F9FA
MKFAKKWIGIAVVVVLLTVSLSQSQNVRAMDDISNIRLKEEVTKMVEAGVISGYPDGTFRPTANVTRGQFAAFIARALALPEGRSSFPDVPSSANLYGDISRVTQAGIMDGLTNGNFGMNQPISREQVALTIQGVLTYLDVPSIESDAAFTDESAFRSSVSLRAVKTSAAYGIISGKPDGDGFRFDPTANARRDEAAAFISRLLDALESMDEEKPGEGDLTPPEVVDVY